MSKSLDWLLRDLCDVSHDYAIAEAGSEDERACARAVEGAKLAIRHHVDSHCAPASESAGDGRVPIMWRVDTQYGRGYIPSDEFIDAFPRFPLSDCSAAPHPAQQAEPDDSLSRALTMCRQLGWPDTADAFERIVKGLGDAPAQQPAVADGDAFSEALDDHGMAMASFALQGTDTNQARCHTTHATLRAMYAAALRQQAPRVEAADKRMSSAIVHLQQASEAELAACAIGGPARERFADEACRYFVNHYGQLTAEALAAYAPAKVEAVTDGDMHRALDWIRHECNPCSIEQRAHLAAIEEAVAAYDPAKVGADTVCRPVGGVTLREVTDADARLCFDHFCRLVQENEVDAMFDVLCGLLPNGIPVVAATEEADKRCNLVRIDEGEKGVAQFCRVCGMGPCVKEDAGGAA